MGLRRIVGLLIAILALGAGGWWWFHRAEVAPWRPELEAREVATRVLAEHLAQRFPRAKVLVFGNPFAKRPGQSAEIYAFEKANLRGLEQGFGSAEPLVVAYPEIRPAFFQNPDSVYVDRSTTTPLSFLMTEDSFDRLAQAHPGSDTLVSLIGLPVNLRQTKVWRDGPPPRFGLLLPDWRMIGGPEAVRDAVKSEKIAAAVVNRPGEHTDDSAAGKVDKDYKAEFARHYFLVTKDNIEELLRTYPQLF